MIIDDDEEEEEEEEEEEKIFSNHGAISDEDEEDGMEMCPPVSEEDKYFFGTMFEKVEEFDHHLDEPNSWHMDLEKPPFPSQIIGFRWMASRHAQGG